MGLIVDSCDVIAAERKGLNPYQLLALFPREEEIAISVITAVELAHGVQRADTPSGKSMREQFLRELIGAVPVFPVTLEIALRAGRIQGVNAARGRIVDLPDLLIGVTALELGYRVATHNLRHFEEIPGLEIFRS